MKSVRDYDSLLIISIVIGLALYGCFLYITSLGLNPLVLFGALFFILFPFRRDTAIVRRTLTLATITFLVWLISEIAFLLVPFFIAFTLAYILEPFSLYFLRKNVPRLLVAVVIVVLVVAAIACISIFVFPSIFSQLNAILRQASVLVTNFNDFVESGELFQALNAYGFETEGLKDVFIMEVIPRIKGAVETVFQSLLTFLTSLSGVVSQVINVFLVPILLFYFLKDFGKLKLLIKRALGGKNENALKDLQRINGILQAYVGGQVVAALFVAITSALLFYIFDIPYAIVLGLICGLLNPIPYIGIFTSMLIGIFLLQLVGSTSLFFDTFVIIAVVNSLHFIDNYFIQPNIVGKRVGLHPLLLIASLFVFGYFFGIIGLLLAVPTTAVLVMFFNDWLDRKALLQEASSSTLAQRAS